jgi:polyphosphate kinase
MRLRTGVKIRLVVRGICSLIPLRPIKREYRGKEYSGRFLEHTRRYAFNNNSSPRVFISSADWMSRNFDRRIELLFEISRQDLAGELRMILDEYWKDNVKARVLMPDGRYLPSAAPGESFNVQEYFIGRYTE